jgi:formamidopyrimidine-DNA glycosylase
MPELPEVESLRRSLEKVIIGSQIVRVTVKHPKIVSSSGTTRVPNLAKVVEFETDLVGQKIIRLTRRAKNIIIELDSGNCLLVHLKMTGQLVFEPLDNSLQKVLGGHPIEESESSLPNKHTYIIWELDNGALFYNDVRQFGYVLFYSSYQAILDDGHFGTFGLEPMDEQFTADFLAQKLKDKKTPIKTLFLAQSVVVGLGNIYCDEVCFEAGILPTRMCNTLTKKETKKLYESIKKIIPKAIGEGGSSIANYLLGDGSRGNYARYHNVYGRKGKKCFECNSVLMSTVLAGRTTVYCEICQK